MGYIRWEYSKTDWWKKNVRLSKKEVSVIADLDFSKDDLAKFIKDKIKIYIGAFVKITQLTPDAKDYLMPAFTDVAKALGKKLSSTLVFGITDWWVKFSYTNKRITLVIRNNEICLQCPLFS